MTAHIVLSCIATFVSTLKDPLSPHDSRYCDIESVAHVHDIALINTSPIHTREAIRLFDHASHWARVRETPLFWGQRVPGSAQPPIGTLTGPAKYPPRATNATTTHVVAMVGPTYHDKCVWLHPAIAVHSPSSLIHIFVRALYCFFLIFASVAGGCRLMIDCVRRRQPHKQM